ncbi:MAG: VPLPA-CTERM sorting domain-containing protein [Pseudomonadota bacterium]
MKYFFGIVFLLVLAAPSHAISIPLGNHPDGNQSSRGDYGIRLDGIKVTPLGGGAEEGLLLDVRGLTLTLTGTGANGASITGTAHDQFGRSYTVSQSFTVNADAVFNLGTGEFTASAGTLTLTGGDLTDAVVWDLKESHQGSGLAFLFIADGERLDLNGGGFYPGFDANSLVGRGWIMGTSGTNDYLVTAVPLPAAAWLFLSGLAGLGLIRRRKQSLAAA